MFNQDLELAIQQNPNLTVRQFADRVGVKVRTFYRHWLEDTTPKECLEEKRLDIAKQRILSNCNKKISEIARELNFCDHFYFSKWFRRKMGLSPQQYRMLTLKERIAMEKKRNGRNNKKKWVSMKQTKLTLKITKI